MDDARPEKESSTDMTGSRPKALVTAAVSGPGLDLLHQLADLVLDSWLDQPSLRIYNAAQLAERAAAEGANIVIVESDVCGADLYEQPILAVCSCRGDPTNVDVAAATAAGAVLYGVQPALSALLAALGLALGAGGASLFWPLVMSTVSRMASQVVSAVGAFTAAGYVGWVAGAPIVGWISQNLGPARGLQVLALTSFGVAVCTLLSPRRREGMQARG